MLGQGRAFLLTVTLVLNGFPEGGELGDCECQGFIGTSDDDGNGL